jgi:hypothetical protein
MITKKITLKPETTNAEYTHLCNLYDKKGMLRACGSPEQKWMILSFEDGMDYLAWLVANGMATMTPAPHDIIQ